MSQIKNKLLATLNSHLRRDYKKVAHITYYPPTRGCITNCRCGILAMRANSNGLFLLVDGKGNTMITKNLYMNLRETKRSIVDAVSEWEKRTGNVI